MCVCGGGVHVDVGVDGMWLICAVAHTRNNYLSKDTTLWHEPF